jgi:hypothetical protein
MGGGAVVGTPVGDTGGTSANCSVDKVGALGSGRAEDDIAEVWVKPKTTNIYFTTPQQTPSTDMTSVKVLTFYKVYLVILIFAFCRPGRQTV